jgi:hypothetical protein
MLPRPMNPTGPLEATLDMDRLCAITGFNSTLNIVFWFVGGGWLEEIRSEGGGWVSKAGYLTADRRALANEDEESGGTLASDRSIPQQSIVDECSVSSGSALQSSSDNQCTAGPSAASLRSAFGDTWNVCPEDINSFETALCARLIGGLKEARSLLSKQRSRKSRCRLRVGGRHERSSSTSISCLIQARTTGGGKRRDVVSRAKIQLTPSVLPVHAAV